MAALLDPALLAKVVLYVLCLNVALGAFKKILDLIDPTDAQKAASPLYQWVSKAVGILQSIADWASANLPH